MRFSERKEKKAARICRSLVEIEFLFLPFSRFSSVQYEQPPAAGSSLLRRTSSAEKVLLSLHIQTTKRESRLLFLSPFLSSSLVVGESSSASASCSQSNAFSLSLLLAGAFLELRRRDEKHLAGLEREGASTCYLKARSEMPPSPPPPLKKKKKQERSEHKSILPSSFFVLVLVLLFLFLFSPPSSSLPLPMGGGGGGRGGGGGQPAFSGRGGGGGGFHSLRASGAPDAAGGGRCVAESFSICIIVRLPSFESALSLSLSLTMYSSHSITHSFSHERGRGRGRGGHGGGGGGRGDGSGRNNGNFFGNRDEGEQAAVSPFEFEPRFF